MYQGFVDFFPGLGFDAANGFLKRCIMRNPGRIEPGEPTQADAVVDPLGQLPPAVVFQLLEDRRPKYLLGAHPAGAGGGNTIRQLIMNKSHQMIIGSDDLIHFLEDFLCGNQSHQLVNGLVKK